jgi:hypothetical protein
MNPFLRSVGRLVILKYYNRALYKICKKKIITQTKEGGASELSLGWLDIFAVVDLIFFCVGSGGGSVII